MGRPLSGKFFGRRNPGADGNFGAANTAGDADIGGQSVTGITVTTAGTYTTAPTITIPAPALSGEGAVSATGTLYYTPVAGQITVGGTATVAYLATDILTQATTGVKFTPTLSTIAGNTITNTNGTAVTVTSGSYIQGTSFITGGTVTTTTGLAANTTYYVAATTSSSTTVTLASSYANAIAGTAITFTGGSTAISNGAVTIGTVAGTVTSAVYASGTSTTVNTTALATTVASSGAGHTIAVAQWGVNGLTVTQAGDGYLNLTLTPTLTATTTSTNLVTLSSVDEIVPGMKFTVGTTTGGISTGTTYYVATVSVANSQITISDTYAHAIAGTNIVSLTTAGPVTVTTSITNNLSILFSAGTGAATLSLTSAVTTGYPAAGAGRYSAILATAWVAGDSAATNDADVIKQSATRRFKVETTAASSGVCTLVTAAPTSGQMTIQATDSAGGTYYVSKITARKVTLVPITGSQFASGATAQWNFTTAVLNVSVVVDNG